MPSSIARVPLSAPPPPFLSTCAGRFIALLPCTSAASADLVEAVAVRATYTLMPSGTHALWHWRSLRHQHSLSHQATMQYRHSLRHQCSLRHTYSLRHSHSLRHTHSLRHNRSLRHHSSLRNKCPLRHTCSMWYPRSLRPFEVTATEVAEPIVDVGAVTAERDTAVERSLKQSLPCKMDL